MVKPLIILLLSGFSLPGQASPPVVMAEVIGGCASPVSTAATGAAVKVAAPFSNLLLSWTETSVLVHRVAANLPLIGLEQAVPAGVKILGAALVRGREPQYPALLVIGNDETLYVYSTKSSPPALVTTFTLKVAGPGKRVFFSPSGSKLAIENQKGEVTLWNTETGRVISTLKRDPKGIASLFISDHHQVIEGASDGWLTRYEMRTGHETSCGRVSAGPVRRVQAVIDKYPYLAVTHEGTILYYIAPTTRGVIHMGSLFPGGSAATGAIIDAQLVNEGKWIVVTLNNYRRYLVRTGEEQALHELGIPESVAPNSLGDFSFEDNYVKAGTTNGTFLRWRMNEYSAQ